MTETLIIIDGKAGTISTFADDPVLDSSAVSRRASHVEPVSRLLRAAFRVLRGLASDDSPVAAFTRLWPCRWVSDMSPVGGPVLGPFSRRREALTAERGWLVRHGWPS